MNFSGNEARRDEILSHLGHVKISDLFAQIPNKLLYPEIPLNTGLDEHSLRRHFQDLSDANASALGGIRFQGGGFYTHYIPSVVDYVSSMGSFTTAYTPYQAEVSQGTLQSLFEYQTYISEITGMENVNASHYDGATAYAEAFRMMYEANKRKGGRILVYSQISREYREILDTYLQFTDAVIEYRDLFESDANAAEIQLPEDCAALSVSLPDFHGRVADIRNLADRCKEAGILLHIHGDPLLLSVITPPGQLGADVYTGEGQVLGIPVNLGGPHLGIFAVSGKLLRKIPGRIAGETVDSNGKRGFVLALSTREQHIRRERASSNICTNQGLMALRALVYMSAMGRDGLQTVARKCIHNAHYLISGLRKLTGIEIDQPDALHFRELRVTCDYSVDKLMKYAESQGITPGIPVDENSILVSTTEIHGEDELDRLIELFKTFDQQEV
ncbi:aminomethyl-transferring glycine dehydrogenase subunit GcvPA [Salinispira pacifica]|uniref:Glycine dehydrogenase [decarboxylating], glycine cleavage system P1 protein n=1 Tax=Salinispira pacifica TaxID=1307761 RepID=V5WCE5_9SPIO|nr:aminomethyl-transferring glycine dehydrogenase subunit GcvPA [Salinispira pacifica]AHC13458.1 Glycine dehydrogenase [decarboxylating], glycine cleavage system P1 protein [Salinispira pacifica]